MIEHMTAVSVREKLLPEIRQRFYEKFGEPVFADDYTLLYNRKFAREDIGEIGKIASDAGQPFHFRPCYAGESLALTDDRSFQATRWGWVALL